jgi:hypothetical protein
LTDDLALPPGHTWKLEKTQAHSDSFWQLYLCDDCEAAFQTEYFPSGEPCREHEDAPANIGTAA